MDYKNIMGYSNKQKKPKKSNKNRKPTLTENLMNEFGGLKLNKVYTEKDLPPFAKSKINEGPAYEYAKEVKNIEKLKAVHDKELEKLIKKIAKQDKKAAKEVGRIYNNVDREYDNYFVAGMEDILNKLG